MDEQNVGYYPILKRNGVLIPTTTWMYFEHYGKWNEPDTKGQILYDFTYRAI